MSDSRDIESFIACYRRREASSRRMMRSLLSGTGADWENIHRDVWVKVLEKYLELDFVIETGLDPYLNSSIYHAAQDYLRQYLIRDQPVALDEYTSSLADTSQPIADQVMERLNGVVGPSGVTDVEFDLKNPTSWDNRDLAGAVEALSPQQRAVILFWAWREPPPTDREIASEFRIAEETAKTHRRRAMTKLRRTLGVLDSKEKEESS